MEFRELIGKILASLPMGIILLTYGIYKAIKTFKSSDEINWGSIFQPYISSWIAIILLIIMGLMAILHNSIGWP